MPTLTILDCQGFPALKAGIAAYVAGNIISIIIYEAGKNEDIPRLFLFLPPK